MNGATTEPLANTSNPPSSAMKTNTGASQNLRRALMNAKNSTTKSSMELASSRGSELVAHAVRCRPRWLSCNPIAVSGRVTTAAHRIVTCEAHERRHRGNHAEEHDGDDDWAHHRVQRMPELQPEPLRPGERAWEQNRERREDGGRAEKPQRRGPAGVPGKQGEDPEEPSQYQAKTSIGRSR